MNQPPPLPDIGSRVSLRYLRAAGSDPPMADVIGHLLETGPRVRVRAADGAIHELRLADVLYVRRLTDRPVKNSAIRSVEHAAALAWPGAEQQWLDGWLLRAGPGPSLRANSAVPLDMFANLDAVPAIREWYADRGQPGRLAVPERLVRLPDDLPAECETRTMVGELSAGEVSEVVLCARPDTAWLDHYGRDLGVGVLSAVIGGDVVFASIPGAAVGRAAVTEAPDGTRWVGLSALQVAPDRRGRGHGRSIAAALLAWGGEHGATRSYVQVRGDDHAAFGFFESLGFAGQHRTRYLDARLVRP